MIDEKYILAYSLKNAIEHDGKAVVGSVIPALFNHGLTKDKIKDIMPKVNEIIKKVNSMGSDKQNEEYEKYSELVGHRPERDGLPELPNVGKNGVIMRFAPAPSGPMHIGHMISNMASSLYVKRYGGKFYIRIEDTNPEAIDIEAYEGIKRDSDWLFGNVTSYIIQSDRMELYYKYAEKLIEKDSSYVCTCEQEKFKELVSKQKPCPCRKLSVKENQERFRKMLDKKGYKDGEAVLRFKSDLENPNPALRDFPLARINTKKHPRQGNKYRVYPLMNLSVTVDDIELKMTHIIRGKDHKDNSLRQKLIYDSLGIDNFPIVLFMGRVKFTDLILSKSKITAAINEGEFEGWEDVRLPTIASLRKRGYQQGAFEALAIQRGISEVDKVMTQKDFFEILNNFNREILREKTVKASFEKSSEKDANIEILMPDSTKIFAKSDAKPKTDEIIYFEKFGYAKYNSKSGKKLVFWFTHE